MTNAHGDFIWYELMTTDLDAARAFYDPVADQRLDEHGDSLPNGGEYRMVLGSTGLAGGALGLTPAMIDQGARPAWLGYVAVEDVDAALVHAVELGGTVMMPAFDMEGVGRMALLTDPHGAPFYLMRGFSEETSEVHQPDMQAGHFAWNELLSPDPEAAFAFYSALCGWTRGEALQMGEMGSYQMFDQGTRSIGGMMRAPEGEPAHWMFYTAVADIDAAAQAARAHGGEIDIGPVEIPGGAYSLMARDPQGAHFGLVGPRKEASQ